MSTSPFVEEVCPTTPLEGLTILDMFRLFFTSALMATIVDQTNAYARLVLGEGHPWREVTADELWAFLGFCVLMGINHLPAIHHYWSTDPHLHYEPVAGRITRDRFQSIWRFLHFTDAPTPPAPTSSSPSSPPPDRLYKVRPMIAPITGLIGSKLLTRPWLVSRVGLA